MRELQISMYVLYVFGASWRDSETTCFHMSFLTQCRKHKSRPINDCLQLPRFEKQVNKLGFTINAALFTIGRTFNTTYWHLKPSNPDIEQIFAKHAYRWFTPFNCTLTVPLYLEGNTLQCTVGILTVCFWNYKYPHMNYLILSVCRFKG